MGVSKLSNACKVFYTLIVKKGSFEKPLEVEEIPDEDLNKVWLPMDTMETETVSFGEKLTKIKLWLSHNLGPNLRMKYPI